MFTKSKILDAIDELEQMPPTYQNAEKLATFYQIYDHLFTKTEPSQRIEFTKEVTIDRYGDSEFLQAITDKKAEEVWMVIDDLMNTIQALQPRLYRAILDKIREM